jgi:predicted transcriptional regulator
MHRYQALEEVIMTQLNVRVSDGFAEKIREFSKTQQRDMGAIVEAICTEAMAEIEANQLFEEESMEAWERYMETGEHVALTQIRARMKKAMARAAEVAAKGQ